MGGKGLDIVNFVRLSRLGEVALFLVLIVG